jgi:hypothetical protein
VNPRAGILWLWLAAGACAPASEDSAWQNPVDRSIPTVGDISECRADARRQAHLRYPDQAVQEQRSVRYISSPDRFPAENRFFEECIRRKGFQPMLQGRAG